MPQSVNRFGTMNSDVARIYQSDKEYLRAKNMRPVTTTGGTNGSLVNIRGNQCAITFPALRAVYRIQIVEVESGGSWVDGSATISINGETTPAIDIRENTTPAEINAHLANLPNYYDGTYSDTKTFATAYDDNYIYIFQQPEYSGCNGNASVAPSIDIVQDTGDSHLEYVDRNGDSSTSLTSFVPAESGTTVIGSTFINDSTYIFTCPAFNDDFTGQIWELTWGIDENMHGSENETATLKLIYNGFLNFSINHPIPPTAAVGRYEVPSLQRIYWSDNYNPVRSINVKDPNVMAMSPEEISLRPSAYMNMPILSDVCDGCGTTDVSTNQTYQLAYRLRKFNGAITNYSPLSNVVQPIDLALTMEDYEGDAGNYNSITGDVPGTAVSVDRSYTWTVEGIDTNYDIIEWVIVVRAAPAKEDFNVFKFKEDFISNNTTLAVEYTNDLTTREEISMTEFLIDNVTFTHCKSIESKDNRLFYANITNDLGEYLESFDTRAFRFDASSHNIIVKAMESDSTLTTYNMNVVDYSDIPETNDSIPALNLDVLSGTNDSLYDASVKYQRNSTTLGGTGLNISYKFGTKLLWSDKQTLGSSTTFLPVNGGTFGDGLVDESTGGRGTNADTAIAAPNTYVHGFRVPGATTNRIDTGDNVFFTSSAPDQNYNANGFAETMALEYFAHQYKTGQHNEIYRYGIVFTSKQGTKYFVKWIGDIKFPDYSDSIPSGMAGTTNIGGSPTDFRSLFIDNSGAYNNIPYIRFDVTIPPALAALISGYEIVRVERGDDDCTILTQGFINQTMKDGTTAKLYLPPSHFNQDALDIMQLDPVQDTANTYGKASTRAFTFHPFKELCNASPIGMGNDLDDELIIVEKYSRSSRQPCHISPNVLIAPLQQAYQITKLYNYTAITQAKIGIIEAQYIHSGGTTPTLTATGGTYINQDLESSISTDPCAKGCPTIVLGTDANFDLTQFTGGGSTVESTTGGTPGNAKLLALYYRPNKLKGQYGGRTYQARQSNEYISCGAFYKVTEAGTASIEVFGGDIFSSILDVQKAIKYWDSGATPDLHSHTFFVPCQSRFNIELRYGSHVNRNLNDNANGDAAGSDEYFYNEYNSYENNLYKYLPKPVLFNQTNIHSSRVYWSAAKINGATVDDWATIGSESYYDLDSIHGPINAIIALHNRVYAIQNRALSELLINAYATIQDTEGVNLKLATASSVLERHNVMATDVGTSHQWSVCRSPNHITFVDARHRKAYLFDGQSCVPISDVKGHRGYFNKVLHGDILTSDNPVAALPIGILTVYDTENSEFLYTTINQTTGVIGEDVSELYTIAYNVFVDGFTSLYDFTPYIYVRSVNKLYSISSDGLTKGTGLYIHNRGTYGEFYGTIYPSSVKVAINANPLLTKVFDNISWSSESTSMGSDYIDDITDTIADDTRVPFPNDTFNRIRCYNQYQNSDWVETDNTAVTGNIRKLEQNFNMYVPRNKVDYDNNDTGVLSIFDPFVLTKEEFGERMRDKYLIVDLEYDNADTHRLILHNLTSTFRVSDR